MDHMLCLIAQPERECLDHGLVSRIARGLGTTARWLAGDEACEMVVGADPASILPAILQPLLSD